MNDLKKTVVINIRVTGPQMDKARRAAEIMSKRQGEIVAVSTLVREEAMEGIDRIIAQESP